MAAITATAGTQEDRPHVALVRPRDIGAVPLGAPVQDPLGVGFLAATLRARGYRVVLLDAHALNLDNDGLIACLKHLRPYTVGLSLHSFSDYTHCVAISNGLRALDTPPYCIWGGEHATFNAERILQQHPSVDAVALGEGEQTFLAVIAGVLARHGISLPGQDDAAPGTMPAGTLLPIAQGSCASDRQAPQEPDAIAGAVVRASDGRIIHGGFRASISDLDTLPEAHKDIVEMALRSGQQVSVSVLTGRGCTHNCRFCTAHDFMRLGGGTVWRRRSPQAVADEVERLARNYLSHPLVHPVLQFQDVIFLGTSRASKKWVEEYVCEMERRQLRVPFYCMARADAIIANEEMLPRLAGIGLWSVEMGLESGVDRILQYYNKLNSANDNERAVELLRAHGITFDASGFIMFDPFMRLDELRVNARYLTRFGAATWDFFVTRLQLYPGTAMREEMIARGLFDDKGDIGCTSGYSFEDPLVELVADHTYYYDLSIRDLDLALRDAKAALAMRQRRGEPADVPLADAVNLVHETYCNQLLALADLAEAGTLTREFPRVHDEFMAKVHALAGLMTDLLAMEGMARSAA